MTVGYLDPHCGLDHLVAFKDFHSHLREGIYLDPNLDLELQGLIIQHRRDWPLVFTHGDLSSLNILACGDKVVGIVDWETAWMVSIILGIHYCLPGESAELFLAR